jgi:hypothetical protein
MAAGQMQWGVLNQYLDLRAWLAKVSIGVGDGSCVSFDGGIRHGVPMVENDMVFWDSGNNKYRCQEHCWLVTSSKVAVDYDLNAAVPSHKMATDIEKPQPQQPQQQADGMKAHWKSLLAMSLVSLSSFQYGLDFGIIGGLQAMIPFLQVSNKPSQCLRVTTARWLLESQVFGHKDPSTPLGYNIPHDRQQLISSLMILGSFVSSSCAGFTASFLGRKASLWTACVGVFVSTAVMQATTTIGGLYAGRFILGLGNVSIPHVSVCTLLAREARVIEVIYFQRGILSFNQTCLRRAAEIYWCSSLILANLNWLLIYLKGLLMTHGQLYIQVQNPCYHYDILTAHQAP